MVISIHAEYEHHNEHIVFSDVGDSEMAVWEAIFDNLEEIGNHLSKKASVVIRPATEEELSGD